MSRSLIKFSDTQAQQGDFVYYPVNSGNNIIVHHNVSQFMALVGRHGINFLSPCCNSFVSRDWKCRSCKQVLSKTNNKPRTIFEAGMVKSLWLPEAAIQWFELCDCNYFQAIINGVELEMLITFLWNNYQYVVGQLSHQR